MSDYTVTFNDVTGRIIEPLAKNNNDFVLSSDQ